MRMPWPKSSSLNYPPSWTWWSSWDWWPSCYTPWPTPRCGSVLDMDSRVHVQIEIKKVTKPDGQALLSIKHQKSTNSSCISEMLEWYLPLGYFIPTGPGLHSLLLHSNPLLRFCGSDSDFWFLEVTLLSLQCPESLPSLPLISPISDQREPPDQLSFLSNWAAFYCFVDQGALGNPAYPKNSLKLYLSEAEKDRWARLQAPTQLQPQSEIHF